MRWTRHEIRMMSAVMVAQLLVAPTALLVAKETVPNGTVKTYRHGGNGSIEEEYTPPPNYSFERIHPNQATEYFNWTPQDLFELTLWTEGPQKISIYLWNPSDTPDLFIGTVEGTLKQNAQAGAGARAQATWEGELRGIHVELLKVPPKYCAQAESHVPLLFTVHLPDDDSRTLAAEEVKVEAVYLAIPGEGGGVYGVNTTKYTVGRGNLYDRPVDTEVANTFTIIVDEKVLDDFEISPDHMIDDAAWAIDVSVKAKDGTWVRCGEYGDGSGGTTGEPAGCVKEFIFGDDYIPVYELKVGRTTSDDNGRYDVTQQDDYWQQCDTDFWGKSAAGNYYPGTSTFNWGWGPQYGVYGTPTATNTLMYVKYDTDADNPYIGTCDLRFAVADERRGGNVTFVEGRSAVPGTSGGEIADVWDPSINSEGIGFEYFTEGGGQSQSLKMSWGEAWSVDTTGDNTAFAVWALSAAGVIGSLAVSVVTVPVTGGASLYVWSVGVLCADVGLMSLILAGDVPNATGKEWGTYIADGEWAIESEVGTVKNMSSWSGGAQSAWHAPITGPSSTGSYPGWTSVVPLSDPHTVVAGDSLSGYISGSITAGSPSGTYLLGLCDYDLDVWLEMDISADKYVDILSAF